MFWLLVIFTVAMLYLIASLRPEAIGVGLVGLFLTGLGWGDYFTGYKSQRR